MLMQLQSLVNQNSAWSHMSSKLGNVCILQYLLCSFCVYVGTEPWTFYFMNGFLNFNFIFLLALAAAFVVFISQKLSGLKFPGKCC